MAKKPQKSRTVTASRSAGQVSTVAVVLTIAAVAAWLWWKRRKADDQSSPRANQKVRNAGGRSPFRFPGAKQSSNSSRQQQQIQKHQAFSLPAAAAPGGKVAGARRGNPKKQNKKQRREEKLARKEGKGKGLELIHNADLKEKDDDGSNTIKYVDMGQTGDIYDKVREYQETGKKRYP